MNSKSIEEAEDILKRKLSNTNWNFLHHVLHSGVVYTQILESMEEYSQQFKAQEQKPVEYTDEKLVQMYVTVLAKHFMNREQLMSYARACAYVAKEYAETLEQKPIGGLPKLDEPIITEEDFQEYFKSEAKPIITDEAIETMAEDAWSKEPFRDMDLFCDTFIKGFKAALKSKNK